MEKLISRKGWDLKGNFAIVYNLIDIRCKPSGNQCMNKKRKFFNLKNKRIIKIRNIEAI